MRVRHVDGKLERMESEADYQAGWSVPIVRAFREVMFAIRYAPDERDFYRLKSLHFEKLKGKRSHQHSMRLNKQFRLIVELEGQGRDKIVVIVAIEDYH